MTMSYTEREFCPTTQCLLLLGLQHDGTHKQPFIILVSCWDREKDRTVQIRQQTTDSLKKAEHSWKYFSLGSLTHISKRTICDPDGHQLQPLKLNKAVVMITETLCALEQIQGCSLLLEQPNVLYESERNCKRPRTVSTEPRSSVLWDWTLRTSCSWTSWAEERSAEFQCSQLTKKICSVLSFITIFISILQIFQHH